MPAPNLSLKEARKQRFLHDARYAAELEKLLPLLMTDWNALSNKRQRRRNEINHWRERLKGQSMEDESYQEITRRVGRLESEYGEIAEQFWALDARIKRAQAWLQDWEYRKQKPPRD